ncbi:hypothetical protein AAFF_G00056720 [Aldrovandia affinis]|uniref:Uncharacterized protein n=1 Tax=Aldrovandia affinis TaxID=143900 RepID=A0AAD7S0Z4_9TELE|nr:hypothetical protein AAFF_G00056720 [Aldrovandia affinis]
MAVHLFAGRGKTRSVTKRCARREDCYGVGCQRHRDPGHTECISCCEGMACNVEVPTNHSNAVFAMRQAPPGSSVSTNRGHCVLSLLAVASVVLVLL